MTNFEATFSLDTTQARREADDLQQRLTRAAEKRVNLQVNGQQHDTAVATIRRGAELPVSANTGRANAAITALRGQLRRGAEMGVNADTSAAQTEVQRLRRLVEAAAAFEVLADVDDAQLLDTIVARFRRLATNIPVTTSAPTPTATRSGGFQYSGTIVREPMSVIVGEGYRPEIIAPLTDMGRTVDLFNQADAIRPLITELVGRGMFDTAAPNPLAATAARAAVPVPQSFTSAAPIVNVSPAPVNNVAPVIQVTTPEGMNHQAWSAAALQQVTVATERAAAEAANRGQRR